MIGCAIYRTFLLCWLCKICIMMKDNGKINKAPQELSQFQRHLQQEKQNKKITII